jgi:hypothetical protein
MLERVLLGPLVQEFGLRIDLDAHRPAALADLFWTMPSRPQLHREWWNHS